MLFYSTGSICQNGQLWEEVDSESSSRMGEVFILLLNLALIVMLFRGARFCKFIPTPLLLSKTHKLV